MNYTLANEQISITVNAHGAELQSLTAGGKEYLWQGDPAYWAERSPLLFPIVGSAWQDTYRLQGKSYQLHRHGFAKNTDFTLVAQTADSITLRMTSTPETLKVYPFDFELYVRYTIEGKTLRCRYKVMNKSEEIMHYQIGGHPGFALHDFTQEGDPIGYIDLHNPQAQYILVGDGGCAMVHQQYTPNSYQGLMPLTRHIFDNDALIFQEGQVRQATLLDKHCRPILTMHTDAPVMAFWAAKGGDAPYVCFEPWFGRCDSVGFMGDMTRRDYMQHLGVGATARIKAYEITLL